MASLKMSAEGLEIIDKARQQKRWDKTAEVLCEIALTSKATLKRFWRKQPIQQETFIRICLALGVEKWQAVIEGDSENQIPSYSADEGVAKVELPSKIVLVLHYQKSCHRSEIGWDESPRSKLSKTRF